MREKECSWESGDIEFLFKKLKAFAYRICTV